MVKASNQAPDFCPIDFLERDAYNAAFSELGLRWRWGNETLARLEAITDERERVRTYLSEQQAHLLKSYDADFLINAILEAKTRARANAISTGKAAGADGPHPSNDHHTQEIGF